MLLPAVIMLRHLDERDAADRLMAAIETVLASGVHPSGMGGDASCHDFCAALRNQL
jgi:isocitrate/isopropylmalate dehydrogenase